jgi:hypothetical protein
MAGKSDFTPAEWTTLLESVMMAGIAVTAADPSGLRETAAPFEADSRRRIRSHDTLRTIPAPASVPKSRRRLRRGRARKRGALTRPLRPPVCIGCGHHRPWTKAWRWRLLARIGINYRVPRNIPSSSCRANQIQDSQAPSAGGCGEGQFGFFDLN